MLSLLATFFTLIQQREVGVIRDAKSFRRWLSNGIQYHNARERLVWLTIWTLVPGLNNSPTLLNCSRATQGLALAAFMPSTFAILGKLYVPGRRKTVIISIYSAFNCLGFFGGFIVAGALGIDHSQWYFYIGSILAALTALIAWLTIPRQPTTERHRNVSMDWLGSFFIVSGLLLLSYALAAEPYADEHSEKDGFGTATVLMAFMDPTDPAKPHAFMSKKRG
jgi:MFS family permease